MPLFARGEAMGDWHSSEDLGSTTLGTPASAWQILESHRLLAANPIKLKNFMKRKVAEARVEPSIEHMIHPTIWQTAMQEGKVSQ